MSTEPALTTSSSAAVTNTGSNGGSSDAVLTDLGVYYFKWNGETLVKQFIDYGPSTDCSGLGIHMAIADLTGNGRLDIVAPGKEGLYVFENLGNE